MQRQPIQELSLHFFVNMCCPNVIKYVNFRVMKLVFLIFVKN